MASIQINNAQAKNLKDHFVSSHSANAIRGYVFTKKSLLALLDQKGASGVRVHLGDDGTGKIVPYLMATDSADADMTGGPIYTSDRECPPYCGD